MNESRRLGVAGLFPHPFPPRRGAIVPRKSKKQTPTWSTSAAKRKRGRPKKVVAPEALVPFERHKVAPAENIERQDSTIKLAAAKRKSLRTNPATSDRCYTADEMEFMNALAEFKRASGRMFPTCSEILGVLRNLGYEKGVPQ